MKITVIAAVSYLLPLIAAFWVGFSFGETRGTMEERKAQDARQEAERKRQRDLLAAPNDGSCPTYEQIIRARYCADCARDCMWDAGSR